MNKLLFFIITMGGIYGGCEFFWDAQHFDTEEVVVFRANSIKPAGLMGAPLRLKSMTWNIKYGAGRIPFWFDCWGDRVQMTKDEVTQNMEGIYKLINELNPDILMVQEIELNSRRSAYYNMIQGILENTDLNYGAYFESWDSRYVPSEGLGRINLGMATFSKYPIQRAERIKQAERTDQDALTSAFYIKRVIGRTEIALLPDQSVVSLVVHTSAYDGDGTKKKQLEQIYDVASRETLPVLLGGDFNALPPVALQNQGFMDERIEQVCDEDFQPSPYNIDWMNPFFDTMYSAITRDMFGDTQELQKRYFSHSILGPDDYNEQGEKGFWSRTLDYLFVSTGTWVLGSTDVVQQMGQKIGGELGVGPQIEADVLRLSDHAPVVGIWELTNEE